MEKIAITIGRSYGSNGSEIGKKLASRLDIPFYDKEIIEEQVKKSGFTGEYIKSFDEKKTSSLLYSIFMNPESIMLQSGFGQTQPIDMAIQKVQIETIREIADKGPCVIVGRRADKILKDNYETFSVFITAEADARVAFVAQNENLSPKDAETKINRMDRSRRSYYNYYGDGTWGDASNYDLCINTSKVSIDSAVEMVITYLKSKKLV